jgi:hypothetical protein
MDDHDRLLEEAQSFLVSAVAPKSLHAANIGVQCSACKHLNALERSLGLLSACGRFSEWRSDRRRFALRTMLPTLDRELL